MKSQSVTIQVKATEQYFAVVLFVNMLYTTEDNAHAVIGQYLLIIMQVNHMENVINI